ncbi:MAG: MotA/TolQ/ExbB proton channel family protein [Verrucomicrobiota bacterium]
MYELIKEGGPVMWVILFCSLLVVVIFLERLLHLHRAQIKDDDFLNGIFNVLRRNNLVEAVSICDETPGPSAYIVREAILNHEKGPAELEKAVNQGGQREISRLERNLPLLATLAKITPMIGLLGTVLGLLNALAVMSQEAPLTHADDLSRSMWEALLTTAAGLAAAIPAYVAYNFLVGRVESIVVEMDRTASEILTFLSSGEMEVEEKEKKEKKA